MWRHHHRHHQLTPTAKVSWCTQHQLPWRQQTLERKGRYFHLRVLDKTAWQNSFWVAVLARTRIVSLTLMDWGSHETEALWSPGTHHVLLLPQSHYWSSPSSCITKWLQSCTASNVKSLQHAANAAKRMIGASLITLGRLEHPPHTKKHLASLTTPPTPPQACPTLFSNRLYNWRLIETRMACLFQT